VPFDEISYEDWSGCVQTNLTGSFLCAQQAFRMMKSQTPQGGRYGLRSLEMDYLPVNDAPLLLLQDHQ
jgi:NAD(P)-dependent dehydrogenase (short-subunit alcohol dehydrogenase family)